MTRITLALAASLLAPVGATAQDPQAHIAEVQKRLAAGSDAQKRLRVDALTAADGKVKVRGVFLDGPPAKEGAPTAFDTAQDEAGRVIRDLLNDKTLRFDWSGVARVAEADQPHAVLQRAANAAGAKGDAAADRCLFAASRFGPDGALVLSGLRDRSDATGTWFDKAVADHLAKHPAVNVVNGKPRVTDAVKPVAWKLTSPEVQKLFAASPDGATRRLRVDRVHLTYDAGPAAHLRLAGVRLGEDAVAADAIPDTLRTHWPELFAGSPRVLIDLKGLLGPGIPDFAGKLQAAVAANPALDGVRIDPGAEFDPDGALALAGVQPGLTADAEKALNAVYQSVLKGFADKGDAAAERYKRLAAGPISVERMQPVATGKLLAGLRAWAADTADDVRVSRVYFAADGSLTLDATTATAADAEKLTATFKELAAKHLDKSVRLAPTAPKSFGAGLTAHLRAELAADPKAWTGVLVERGLFDAAGRFTLRGVVDDAAQGAALAKRLDALAADPKWAAYFAEKPNKPALEVVALGDLVERLRRVTPAYPGFDGVRVEAIRYDAAGNLVFDVTAVGKPAGDPAAVLAKLLRDHPTYRRRLPPGRPIKLAVTTVAVDTDAKYTAAAGAKLLEAGDAKRMAAWVDAAILYNPGESGVWFLGAYHHYLQGDRELVRRDLLRAIALESAPTGAIAQRKGRYEAAKNLQGRTRTELEALWEGYAREAKDGAKPLTLAKEK